jgi:hypothetical protein
MGELVNLADWRRPSDISPPATSVSSGSSSIAKIQSGPEHGLAGSILKNMLSSHGLMLRHKDQIERDLCQSPPKPVA